VAPNTNILQAQPALAIGNVIMPSKSKRNISPNITVGADKREQAASSAAIQPTAVHTDRMPNPSNDGVPFHSQNI
jgi:hypothetical protein